MSRYIVDIRKAGNSGCGTIIGGFFILALILAFITSLAGRIILGCLAGLGLVCLIWCIYCYKKDESALEPSQKLKRVISSNRWATGIIVTGVIAAIMLIISFSIGDITDEHNSYSDETNTNYSNVSNYSESNNNQYYTTQ